MILPWANFLPEENIWPPHNITVLKIADQSFWNNGQEACTPLHLWVWFFRSGIRQGRLWENLYPLFSRKSCHWLWSRSKWWKYNEQCWIVITPVFPLLNKFQPQVNYSTSNNIGAPNTPLFRIRLVTPNKQPLKLKAYWFYETKPSKHFT